jgi:hypothetical protein
MAFIPVPTSNVRNCPHPENGPCFEDNEGLGATAITPSPIVTRSKLPHSANTGIGNVSSVPSIRAFVKLPQYENAEPPNDLSEGGKSTERKLPHPEKAEPPMFVRHEENSTPASAEQSENAMTPTFAHRVKSTTPPKRSQLSNASLHTFVHCDKSMLPSSCWQLENACPPIVLGEPPSETETRLVHWENAEFPMDWMFPRNVAVFKPERPQQK